MMMMVAEGEGYILAAERNPLEHSLELVLSDLISTA